MGRREKLRFGLALALGVAVPGLLDYLLSAAGYETLGLAVWTIGYLGAAVGIWYVWIRPLDLRGPSG